MYRLNENVPLTPERIQAYIQDFKGFKLLELLKYRDYYKGKHAITRRTLNDPNKPNNKVVHAYANYISNTMAAYFMGNPVKYSGKDGEDISELVDVFNYNDEPSENMTLAKESSIYGISYELVYVDTDGKIRFKHFEPLECIPICDDTLEEELLYFIRFYDVQDILDRTTKTIVEVYDRQLVTTYESTQGSITTMINQRVHGFKGFVPVSIYKNNEEETNDFGKVISLIDAYDSTVSDSVNDMDAFADSYMVLKGLGNVDQETLDKMRENRVLLLDDESEASFLVKDVNNAYSEGVANRLNDDIYKFSGCVDLTSDVSALSGVAIKYRMLALENNAATKENYFKKGLYRRIELIDAINNAIKGDSTILNVDIKFTRNLPTDDKEAVAMVNSLEGIVSQETYLSLLPFVDDPAAEIEKIKAETSDYEEGHSNEEEREEEQG